MIGRKSQKKSQEPIVKPQGFDDYDLRLGDVMRGERATLGKSLLDVQRELRIKASYIAAIENCDPSAFDTPGFIAGYVRSYARYLGMNPDEAFAHFCAESGFSTAHGMSDAASTIRKAGLEAAPRKPRARDPLAEPATPFAPGGESIFARLEPSAIGSTLVLVALIAGVGYGGWSVLQEIQRVQLAPVDQTPIVLSELDPLDVAVAPDENFGKAGGETAGMFTPPSGEAFDRLYRPQALDVPVLVARDAPISTLDPTTNGAFADTTQPNLPRVQDSAVAALADTRPVPGGSDVTVVAVRPAWVQIREADGNMLFSGILNAGDTFAVPAAAISPEIQTGESGSVYFSMNGQTYGPAGARGSVTSGVGLTSAGIAERYALADPLADRDLLPVINGLDLAPRRNAAPTRVATASAPAPAQPAEMPKVLADPIPGVTIVAAREAWVRVKAPSGAVVYEAIMAPGDTYTVARTAEPPTIRTGDAGAIYFAAAGKTYGPYGGNGAIADNMALSVDTVTRTLAEADLPTDSVVAKTVAQLRLNTGSQ
ncbi:MAG: DUF4115 domain-containing protein [Paracoccaceae bacterium]|nr:DUF4115 domain-containing protein [Paracoccaceae bacterium]